MAWYYVSSNQRRGPLEQAEFDGLVRQGMITDSTLVWREGMANWQAYREVCGPAATVASAAPAMTAATVATPGMATAAGASAGVNVGGVVCSQCGRALSLDQVVKIGNQYVCAACKPLAVQKLQEGVVNTDAEQLRKAHINHEASVKSVGLLYFLGAALLLLASIGMTTSPVAEGGRIIAGLFLGLAALQIWAGIGLRRLRPWSRVPSGILSGLGLLAFPVGTLINGYILYLLFSKKGATVFSEEYQRVIEQTPHIKYRTSIVIWVLLVLLLLLIGGAVLMFFLSSRR